MIVVTGATGNVGRALAQTLTEAGERVTGVARNITAADAPPLARAIAADMARPTTLRPALDGADALFLLVAGEEPEALLTQAADAGVRKVVLLSSQGAGTRPQAYQHAARFEETVAASGLDWTILRSGGMATNTFSWIEPIRTSRVAPAPFGDVGLPFIDPADVADVAAMVLREHGHKGATYVLTGPALTTPRQRATAIAEAIGAPIRFIEQTRDEAYAQMTQFMPAPVAEGTLAILGEPTEHEQQISPDVQRILGRASQTFAAWAHRNAAVFQ